jgi:DNA polymerase-1
MTTTTSSIDTSSSIPLVGPVGPEGPMRIVLLDSSGPLHRCYHGYVEERMGRVDGKRIDVAAVYGYCMYIRKLAEQLSFDRLFHVLDSERGSFARLTIYPEYKGQRSPTPPPLAAQKALLPQILRSFGHTVVQKAGVEADDLIATLARRYAALGHEVLVVSQDKDLMQLVVDGQITLARYVAANPNDKRKTHAFYEEADVIRKFNVRPEQIVDWLALVGDTADNIPGVFRVGEKTASDLLSEHGSLAAVITNAATIKGALGKNLMEALPMLPLYRRLTQAIEDVEIDEPVASVIDPALADAARLILNINCPDDLYGDIVEAVNQAEEAPPVLHDILNAAPPSPSPTLTAAADDDFSDFALVSPPASRLRGP